MHIEHHAVDICRHPESSWTNVQRPDTSLGCIHPHTECSLLCIHLRPSASICVHLQLSTCICLHLHVFAYNYMLLFAWNEAESLSPLSSSALTRYWPMMCWLVHSHWYLFALYKHIKSQRYIAVYLGAVSLVSLMEAKHTYLKCKQEVERTLWKSQRYWSMKLYCRWRGHVYIES